MVETKYFAQKPIKELAEELSGMFDVEHNVTTQQLRALWSRNYRAYYSDFLDNYSYSEGLGFSGEHGEQVEMRVNQAKSFTNQLKSLITKQRLNFDAVTSNSDTASMSTAKVAKAISDSVVKNHNIERKAKKMVEQSLVLGSSFLMVTWDQNKGESYAVEDDGEIIGQGDLDIKVIPPWDVHFNKRLNDWEELDWIIVREKDNRWDLIAEYPNLEEELLAVESVRENTVIDEEAYNSFLMDELHDDEDMIYVYKFFHRSTAAMPLGRVVTYCNSSCILEDIVNIYEFLPVIPYMPQQLTNYLIGYPMFSDLLPLQEMIDSNYSAISSNQLNFGIQNILNPNGNDIQVTDLEGCRFINYSPMVGVEGGGKPEPLQLAQSAPELFKFSDMLKANMMELSGINETLRGMTPPGVTSGVAIATLSANAVENASDYIHSYVSTLEELMTKCLKIYKRFVEVERVVEVTGFNNTYETISFKGDDLSAINNVRLTTANPLSQTLSGRITIAQELLANGLISNPKEYLDVLNTGNINSATESNSEELDLARSENDYMQKGSDAIATVMDDHASHILIHRKLLQNPVVRTDPKAKDLIARVTSHIQEHIGLVNSQDPVLASIILTGQAQPVPVDQTTLPPTEGEQAPVEGTEGGELPENLDVIQGE